MANFRLCERKPLWQLVVKVPRQTSKSLELGNRVHLRLERYLKANEFDYTTDKEAQEILEPALPYFPMPGEAQVEGKIQPFQWEGLTFGGRLDVKLPRLEDRPGVIYDLKTTKDKKWAKTANELICDPQPIIYFKAYENEVDSCRWVYTLTQGARKAWPVDFRPVTSGPVVDSLLKDAEKLTKYVTEKKHPLTVLPPTDTNVCSAFGGCPYRSLCTDISPFRGVNRKEPEMSFADVMNRLGQSVQPATAPPVESPTTENTEVAAVNPPEQALAGPPPLPAEEEKPTKARKRRTKAEVEAAKTLAEAPKPEGATLKECLEIDAAIHGKAQTVEPKLPESKPLVVEMLLLDCMPEGPLAGKVKNVAHFIEQAHEIVKERSKVAHYKFIDYGEGTGAIAAVSMALMADSKEELVLFMNTSLPESKLIENALVAKAKLTIRRT